MKNLYGDQKSDLQHGANYSIPFSVKWLQNLRGSLSGYSLQKHLLCNMPRIRISSPRGLITQGKHQLGFINKQRHPQEAKEKGGFTLLEVLFCVLILSVALISIASVFFQITGYIQETKEITIVASALQEQMEEVRNMPFTQILALPTTFTTDSFSQLYNPTGTITVDNPLGISSLRRVSISITWNSYRGRQITKNLVTYVTQNGINRK